jgi:hypothetical protein
MNDEGYEHMTVTEPDEPWLEARTGMSRARKALLLLLGASLCLLGGIQLERHVIADEPAASSSSGLPSGLPDFGGGGLPAGFPGGTGQTPATGSSPTTSGSGGASTSVIGTVVSRTGDRLTVKDLGGKTHTLTLAEDTVIHRDAALTVGDLKPGQTVVVENKAGSGSTAADITIR